MADIELNCLLYIAILGSFNFVNLGYIELNEVEMFDCFTLCKKMIDV